MSATITQARDEMLAKFRTAWLADETSADVPVMYPDVAQETPDEGAWARITVQHTLSQKATLSNANGKSRYRRQGTVFVQIFTDHADGQVTSDALVIIAMGAFEGEVTSPGRVIFRNVRPNEVGQDGQWYQVNVLADFEYDEIR